jgi:uncharacterized membrane protein
MLSLQASYAAPLILLAQNRQADRDRVALEQDRSRDERNLADTEFLTREVAALRIAMRDRHPRLRARRAARPPRGDWRNAAWWTTARPSPTPAQPRPSAGKPGVTKVPGAGAT